MDKHALETLAQDGQQTLAVFEQARRQISDVELASDPEGVVVALGADGLVQRITVLHGWSDETPPEGLAGLVVGTLARANGERVTTWLTMSEELSRQPLPRADATAAVTAGRAQATVGGRGVGLALDEVQREIRQAGGLGAIFDATLSDLMAAGRTEYTGSGQGDRATARCTMSGDVTALELNLPWLREAPPSEIGAEITRAVVTSQRRALEAPQFTDLVRQSRLGALQRRLTESPRPEGE